MERLELVALVVCALEETTVLVAFEVSKVVCTLLVLVDVVVCALEEATVLVALEASKVVCPLLVGELTGTELTGTELDA